MKFNKTLVLLVAMFAIAVSLIASASASITISKIEVAGFEGNNSAVFAGQTVPVWIQFNSSEPLTDVRVKAEIFGGKTVSTGRFDVISGKVYTSSSFGLLNVEVPSDIETSGENPTLIVSVEGKSEDGYTVTKDSETILSVQRESYSLGILDAIMDNEVEAGTNLDIDVVLQNVGRHNAKNTFVNVKIPALGVERRAFFNDVYSNDNSSENQDDSVERRITLRVPSNAPAGIYLVEIKAYNGDSDVTATKRVVITNKQTKEESTSTTTDTTATKTTAKNTGFTNTTIVLTVILGIIFVVLLVVLIVLLTRKPQKAEEFGESYY